MNNSFKTDPLVIEALRNTITGFSYDQYRMYRASDGSAWMEYLFQRIHALAESNDAGIFFEVIDGEIYLLGCRTTRWDEEHYGFGMAKIDLLVCPIGENTRRVMGKLIGECLNSLRGKGIRFVSSHISGADLSMLHLLEDCGFRYYQTTAYAIADFKSSPPPRDPSVRQWRPEDLPAVVDIARRSQFRGGHFYSDNGFDRDAVDSMYDKWIRTSWHNQDPIAVMETDGKISGYFAFVMDGSLSSALGHSYGRMTSLAIDGAIHGVGLGSRLFGSVMAMIREMGGKYIVSEYPTKNFASAKLHAKNGFLTIHEKVLSHLWL